MCCQAPLGRGVHSRLITTDDNLRKFELAVQSSLSQGIDSIQKLPLIIGLEGSESKARSYPGGERCSTSMRRCSNVLKDSIRESFAMAEALSFACVILLKG